MVVWFITTYAISAYHHYQVKVNFRSCEVYSIKIIYNFLIKIKPHRLPFTDMSQQRLEYARFMVLNTTFNNFSIIWFYLLLGKTIILFLIYFALWGKLAGTGSVNEFINTPSQFPTGVLKFLLNKKQKFINTPSQFPTRVLKFLLNNTVLTKITKR
jgi:hypothetical protein